jgi:hypothetical protein
MTKLSDVKPNSDSPTPTPPQKFANYFIHILKILGGFILFCWWATSNYLNSLHINTDESYPIFNGKLGQPDGKNASNPYATRFSPGPVDVSNEEDINAKVGLMWWLERTQQSSYQFGGLVLHNVFNFFKGQAQKIEQGDSGNTDSKGSTLFQLFSFLQWFLFGIVSNLVFVLFLMCIVVLCVPGFLGGLTAFMPRTYFTTSTVWQICKKLLMLIISFILFSIGGWVFPFIPVVTGFLYLFNLMSFKQLMDNKSRFITEFMKRMKQLIFIYLIMSVIIAFSSNDLPDQTKFTIASVCCIILIYIAYNMFQGKQATK